MHSENMIFPTSIPEKIDKQWSLASLTKLHVCEFQKSVDKTITVQEYKVSLPSQRESWKGEHVRMRVIASRGVIPRGKRGRSKDGLSRVNYEGQKIGAPLEV